MINSGQWCKYSGVNYAYFSNVSSSQSNGLSVRSVQKLAVSMTGAMVINVLEI